MRTSRKRPSASPGLFVCFVAEASATSIAQFAAFALNILRAQRTTLELLNRSHYCTIFKLCPQRLARIPSAACMHACMQACLGPAICGCTCVCDTGRCARCSSHSSRLSLPNRAASGAATWAGAPALSGKGRCRARHLCYPHNRPHPAQDRPQNKSAASASAAGTRSRTPVGSITASSSAQSPNLAQKFLPA